MKQVKLWSGLQVWVVMIVTADDDAERIWGMFSSEKKAKKSVKQHKIPATLGTIEYQVYDVDYRLQNKPVKYAK